LERAAIDDDGGGLLLAASHDPRDLPQAMNHVLEDTGPDLALDVRST
jgi:hypothetical protein